MKNRWAEKDAKAMARKHASLQVSRDLSNRVYTSRLLGSDTRLVLHGGGNTSVKTTMTDVVGDVVDVLGGAMRCFVSHVYVLRRLSQLH